jgi:hypothetical protein
MVISKNKTDNGTQAFIRQQDGDYGYYSNPSVSVSRTYRISSNNYISFAEYRLTWVSLGGTADNNYVSQYDIPVWGYCQKSSDALAQERYADAVGWWLCGLTEACSFGILSEVKVGTAAAKVENQIIKTSTRVGKNGNAVEVLFKNGNKMDINAARVKEWVTNLHPDAPVGTYKKVKFDNFIPGSKGYKRVPTQGELDFLNNLFK